MDRMKWKQRVTLAAFGCFTILACNSIAGVPDAEWTSRFGGVTGGVQATPDDRPRIKSGPSGETFAYGFFESGLGESAVTRFGGDIATPVWSTIDSYDDGDFRAQPQLFPSCDLLAAFQGRP